MTTEPRTSRLDPISSRVGLLALALALLALPAAGDSVGAQGAREDLSQAPGLCLEATAAADPVPWTEVVGAIESAAAQQPDFFPAALAASSPDPARLLHPAGTPAVRIGVWALGPEDAASIDEARELLERADCLVDGNAWTAAITRELLLAGAERILAAARLPDEHGEVLVPEGALADIDVEFHRADRRVRTSLEFEVDIGFGIIISGDCWIDDVLSVADGHVVSSSTADMDVSPFGERACQKFERFMDAGGAGERAAELLRTSVALASGTEAAFVASSVEVDDDTISLSGTVETG